MQSFFLMRIGPHRITLAILLAVLALVFTPACAALHGSSSSAPATTVPAPPAAKARRLSVPPPTGEFPVGVATLSLLDRKRPDPFARNGERRRILAEVYYPSVTGNGKRARYMPAGVAKALATPDVPAATLRSVTTNADLDARARPGRYPVLIFSPGYSVPHYMYTGLIEDLASRGYVVIAVDHTYETQAVQFPNGATVHRTLPANPKNLTFKPIRARIDDVSFVLRRLKSLRRLASLGGADVTKIGVFGHSLGGLTAANVAAANASVSCAADLAGSVYGDARRKPFRRPFLIIDGAQRESTLARWWANLKGTRYWVILTRAKHLNFTDWTWLVPRLKAEGLTPHVQNLGAIDGTRALRLERQYLNAFFDECLKRQPSSVFGSPAPYPDVVVKR